MMRISNKTVNSRYYVATNSSTAYSSWTSRKDAEMSILRFSDAAQASQCAIVKVDSEGKHLPSTLKPLGDCMAQVLKWKNRPAGAPEAPIDWCTALLGVKGWGEMVESWRYGNDNYKGSVRPYLGDWDDEGGLLVVEPRSGVWWETV